MPHLAHLVVEDIPQMSAVPRGDDATRHGIALIGNIGALQANHNAAPNLGS
jgi:hypothetical protein